MGRVTGGNARSAITTGRGFLGLSMPIKREPLYVVEVKTGTQPVRWERCTWPMSRTAAETYVQEWMQERTKGDTNWTYRARPVKSDAD